MTQKSTLLHKTIRVAKFNKNLALALLRHDLLLSSDNDQKQNRIASKSHLNVYTFQNQKITSEEERQKVLDYVSELYSNHNQYYDSTKFSKLKFKLKKWIESESEKISDCEKEIYKEILEQTELNQSEKIDLESILSDLSLIGKISRYNDKKRAIEQITELHNQRTELDVDQKSQLNCRVVSALMKIPGHNKVNLPGELQEQIVSGYYREKFPDYSIIYTAIHKDEINEHVHLMIDAKNKRTNEHDFVQKQYEYIKNKHNLADFSELYSKATKQEIVRFGELIQQDFYDYANQKLKQNNQNIIFEKKEYLTKIHKFIERSEIKSDTNKRIADREYNTANYLAKLKNQCVKKIKRQKDEIIQQKDEIIQNKSEIEELKQEKSNIYRIMKDAFNDAVSYAKSALSRDLYAFYSARKDIKNDEMSQFLTEESAEIQPTEQQKENIKRKID